MIMLILFFVFSLHQSIPMPGPGARSQSSASNHTCGNTTVEANNESPSAGFTRVGTICVPGGNATVTSCMIYTGATTSYKLNCGIYDSDGTAGAPKTLICSNSTGVTSTAATFITIPMSGCGTLTSGHTYYIGWQNESNTSTVRNRGDGTMWYVSSAYGSYADLSSPSTWPATYSMYLNISY